MSFSNPRKPPPTTAHLGNGRKPIIDDATALEIKRKHDAGATKAALASEYGVRPHTIRAALWRAEFGKAAT